MVHDDVFKASAFQVQVLVMLLLLLGYLVKPRLNAAMVEVPFSWLTVAS